MLTRRALIAAAGGGAASQILTAADAPKLKICAFSKHFQWTDWQETAALAAEIGFDGVDFTVRSGGHILPERVELDLPKAVGIVRKAGIDVPMITAGIVDASSPHAEAILQTASGLGIQHYRWGGFTYDYGRDIGRQLDELKPRVRALSALNEKYGINAMYHTHSGLKQVGASIWDIWTVLRDEDPRWVGINYDIGHATVEGGYGGWVNSAHLVQKFMSGVALKDFFWQKDAKGRWTPQWCGLGQGMVNFSAFFAILKAARFSGPVQLHFEYPELGGAHDGKSKLDIPKPQFIAIMKRDLKVARSYVGQVV